MNPIPRYIPGDRRILPGHTGDYMTEQQPYDQGLPLPNGDVAAAESKPSGLLIIVGAILTVVPIPLGILAGGFTSYLMLPVAVIGVVLLVVGILRAVRTPTAPRAVGPTPTAYTPDGQPIYPVVGYTPDGQPVTADRAIGYANPRTNSLAIVALVLGLVFPLAAIPVGHISLGQIGRTGEQGRGLAIAGLVLGYLTLAIWVIVGGFLVLSNM